MRDSSQAERVEVVGSQPAEVGAVDSQPAEAEVAGSLVGGGRDRHKL